MSVRILKGTARYSGDGWKDSARKGDVVFVYSGTLAPPYAPGQHTRVGFPVWSASEEQFDFRPASLIETLRLLPKIIRDWRDPLSHRNRAKHPLARMVAMDEAMGLYDTDEKVPRG